MSSVTLKELADRADMSHEAAKRLFDEIKDALIGGERVKVSGFGSLDPRTNGDTKQRATVRFRISRPLKGSIRANFPAWHDASKEDDSELIDDLEGEDE